MDLFRRLVLVVVLFCVCNICVLTVMCKPTDNGGLQGTGLSCLWKWGSCTVVYDDVKCTEFLNECVNPTASASRHVHFTFHRKTGQPVKFAQWDDISSEWDQDQNTAIIIHGFRDGPKVRKNQWIGKMATELMKLKDTVNVVVVDWTELAKGGYFKLNYFKAVRNCEEVGVRIASLITDAWDSYGYPASRFHIIGHSLGAQIANHVALNINGNQKLGRISGLDPAGFLFELSDDINKKLDETDAHFVDVIHTNGKRLRLLDPGFGTRFPVGDIDFYPNGGVDNMPECSGGPAKSRYDYFSTSSLICDHMMSIGYYVDSISDRNYTAFPEGSTADQCDQPGSRCTRMGYHVDTGPRYRGKYLLNTM